MLALIGNLDTSELVIALLVAVLIFGRRLPQVAAQAGRQVVKLRRSLDNAWRDTGMEREIREVQRDLQQAIPRDLSIGEMARLASAEMDKRVRANEDAARASTPLVPATETPERHPEGPKGTELLDRSADA